MNHRRIDAHHHVLPPTYVAWLRKEGTDNAGGRALPDWSVQSTLDLMGKFEIETGIRSVSTPGVCPFAPQAAVAHFTGQLEAYKALDEIGRRAMDRDSAAALFPNFSA